MRLSVVRAISAGCLMIVMWALVANPYDPRGVITAFVSVCAAVWMLTAPGVAVHYVANSKPDFRRLRASKWTRKTPPSLTWLSEAMDAPLPHHTKLVVREEPNAATDGNTLYINSGLEPDISSSVGEAVLAHELAHAKLQHYMKDMLVIGAVASIAYLFSAPFWEAHAAIGTFMGLLSFLTLGAFVFPLVSRRMEYDADALASSVVGTASMIRTLEVLIPQEKWAKESDSHPSGEARVRRLQSL